MSLAERRHDFPNVVSIQSSPSFLPTFRNAMVAMSGIVRPINQQMPRKHLRDHRVGILYTRREHIHRPDPQVVFALSFITPSYAHLCLRLCCLITLSKVESY
ncbi:unnamed protein product [Cercospora beticola]|nr:unnamed protein product [Cercospora beticola]